VLKHLCNFTGFDFNSTLSKRQNSSIRLLLFLKEAPQVRVIEEGHLQPVKVRLAKMVFQIPELQAAVFGNPHPKGRVKPVLVKRLILQVDEDFIVKIQEEGVGQGQGKLQPVPGPMLGVAYPVKIQKSLLQAVTVLKTKFPNLIVQQKLLKDPVFLYVIEQVF
jgi:hypothetical protein